MAKTCGELVSEALKFVERAEAAEVENISAILSDARKTLLRAKRACRTLPGTRILRI
mgnify:CR=1 FL=1